MINQETVKLYDRFTTFETLLAQMTNQGSEIIAPLQVVKLEKPKSFAGVINTDAVNVFIFQVE